MIRPSIRMSILSYSQMTTFVRCATILKLIETLEGMVATHLLKIFENYILENDYQQLWKTTAKKMGCTITRCWRPDMMNEKWSKDGGGGMWWTGGKCFTCQQGQSQRWPLLVALFPPL